LAKKEGLKYRLVPIDSSKISKIIKKTSPDMIVTATSHRLSVDKLLVRAAKRHGFVSASLVDYWSNYRFRFGKHLEYLPDYVLAIDREMKKQMIKEKIPPGRIIITGNPAFDSLLKNKIQKTDKDKVIFYSQPFSELKDKTFNEVKILQDLLYVLEKNFPEKKVIVKFHPAEKNYKKFDNLIRSSGLKIKKDTKSEIDLLSKKAELVMGINSMALFLSVLMGKKVLSYQPGINFNKDKLISNRFGWSFPAYRKSEILPMIRLIYDQEFKLPMKKLREYTGNKSTQKVVNFIKNITKLKIKL
jgi:hypothetical protein